MCGLDGTFYRLKAANFNPNLHKIFRYAIRADLAANCHIGGQGEIGGNDFVDHNKDPGSTMHELGHTLGLRHGGLDDHNCKPNYLSVMNYTHQTRIDQTSGGWIIDFSPPRHAGGRGQALPTLRENALDETRALDPGDPSNTFVFTDLRGRVVRHAVNLPVDWDGNGVIDNSQLQPVNIDNPPQLTCDNTSNDSILVGYDDWRHISVPFWQFRDSDNSAVNPVTVHEPTDAELHAIEQAVNTTDLALTVTSSRPAVSIGDALEYSLNVANLGPNQAQQVQVVDTLPAGLLYRGASPSCSLAADNKLTCDL